MAMKQLEKMKQELIDAGLLGPDEEIDRMELISRWSKKQMGGLPTKVAKKKRKPPRPREAYKFALSKLLTLSTKLDYCSLVVDKAWINFRYSKRKDELSCQVAGNKYISPMKLDKKQIKKLEKMGFPADEYSIDIFMGRFDGKDRKIEKIADKIFKVFNEIYEVKQGDDACITLELTAENESTKSALTELRDFVDYRDGKKFCFDWDTDA